MPAQKVSETVYSVGILNPAMRIFDVVMKTEYGTSYNSYIVKGSEKIALIETCHHTFWKQYLENIREVCEPEQIDYIILNHCEPDHSGALRELLSVCTNAQIYVSQAGSIYLKNITNRVDLPLTVAKDGASLDLGGGNVLRFIAAPFLHWPDSMFTWMESENMLFSCDFFGSHYCEPHLFDYNIAYPDKYKSAMKNYYDAIFGPFKPYVLKGLDKIKDLDIETVCSSHGPVLTRGNYLEYVRDQYARWSEPSVNEVKTVPLFYCSAYGNTGEIAKAIQKGILSVIPDANVEIYDINEHDMGTLQAVLNSSDAFGIGSPTINSDAVGPVWNLLSHVDAINNRKKPVIVFGSYGWSGEAVPNLTDRLKGLKTNVFGDGLKIPFVPSEEELKKAEEFGAEFAKTL
ncbi:FprA family A-type flavoprotein [Anaerolentibacter hominis]|uniref:FprA family A-type flavoprotein n=1 Tax=Anaerolentibacter hominis TaxID=3079009 RepID=UPI0031B81567